MGCKYVKDFDFSSAGKTVGYCGGGRVMKKAEGGAVDIKQDKAMIKAAVHKHEKGMHPGKPLTKLAKGGAVPSQPPGMIADRSSLGIKGNKNPGERKGVPVAPRSPMIKPMAKGGQAKVGKVMREYKAGELHSGSKTGPVVKNLKQAIAIALSEARTAKKR